MSPISASIRERWRPRARTRLQLAVCATLALCTLPITPVPANEEWKTQLDAAVAALRLGDVSEARRRIDAGRARLGDVPASDWRSAANAYLRARVALAGGRPDQATRGFQDALAAYTSMFGERSPARVKALSGLGRARMLAGDFTAAERDLRAAAELADGSTLGLEALLSLAQLSLAGGTPGDASQWLAQADGAAKDAEPMMRLWRHEAAARAAMLSGNRERASAELAQAETLAKTVPGPLLARVRLVQALLAMRWGDTVQALPLLAESIRLYDSKGSREHPDLAAALLARARCLIALGGGRGEADSLLQRAQSLVRRLFPAGSELAAGIELMQVRVQVSQGNLSNAIKQLSTLERGLAESRHDALRLQAAVLATAIHVAAGNRTAAHASASSAAALFDAGRTIPGSVSLAVSAALSVAAIGDNEAAQAWLQRAERAMTPAAQGEHPDQVLLLHAQARVALEAGDTRLAASTSERAADLAQRVFAAGSAVQLDTRALLSEALAASGRQSEALAIARASHEQAMRNTADPLSGAYSALRLGSLLAANGHLEEAGKLLGSSLAAARKTLPSRHPELLRFYAPLIHSHVRSGRLRDAAAQVSAASAIVRSAGIVGPLPALVQLRAANVDEANGRFAAALQKLGASRKTLGPPSGTRSASAVLAAVVLTEVEVAILRGDLGVAEQALATLEAGKQGPVAGIRALAGARIAMAKGQPAAAVEMLGATVRAPDTDTGLAPLLYTALSLAQQMNGQYIDAVQSARRGTELASTALGADHPLTNTPRLRLAAALRAAGDFDEYSTLAAAAAESSKRVYGEQHPSHVAALLELAESHRLASRFEQAAAALAQARDILEQFLRSEHPRVLEVALRQSAVQAASGAITDAITNTQRAAVGFTRALGATHPRVALAQLQAVDYMLAGERLDDARKLLQSIGDTFKAPLESHAMLRREYQSSRLSLQLAAGNWPGALAVADKLLDDDAPVVYAARARIARAFAQALGGRAATAVESAQSDLRALEAVLGPGHPAIAPVLLGRAQIQVIAGQQQAALEDLRAGIESVRTRAPQHAQLPRMQLALAELLLDLGRIAEALSLSSDIAEAAERAGGEDHPLTLDVQLLQARARAELGETAQAAELFLTLRSRQQRLLGYKHPALARSGVEYVRVLLDSGDPKGAASLLARLGSSASGDLARSNHELATAEYLLSTGRLTEARKQLEATAKRMREQWAAARTLRAIPLLTDARLAAMQGEIPQAAQAREAVNALFAGLEARELPVSLQAEVHQTDSALAYTARQPARARDHEEQAIALTEQAFGAGSAQAARATARAAEQALLSGEASRALDLLTRAADALRQLGVASSAAGAVQSLQVRALLELGRTNEAITAAGNPQTPTGTIVRALALHQQGQWQEAGQLLSAALPALERSVGSSHPAYGEALVLQGANLNAMGRAADAAVLLRRGLKIQRSALGPQHPSLVPALGQLASALTSAGQTAEARQYVVRQIALVESRFGNDAAALAPALTNLGHLQITAKDLNGARVSLTRAVALDEKHLAADSLTAARDRYRLANLLVALKANDEAEALFSQAADTLRSSQDDRELLEQAVTSLAALRLARGDYTGAQSLLGTL